MPPVKNLSRHAITIIGYTLFVSSIPLHAAGIPLESGQQSVTRVIKRRVVDCRVVKAFQATPVDGKTDTYAWNGVPWEYNQAGGGSGVRYTFNDNQGVHVELADDASHTDAVRVQGGIKIDLYGAGATYRGPEKAPLLTGFPGKAAVEQQTLKTPATGNRFSFFGAAGKGTLADVQFFALERNDGGFQKRKTLQAGATEPAAAAVAPFLEKRFTAPQRAIYALRTAGDGAAPLQRQPVQLQADTATHFIATPFAAREGLTALGVNGNLTAPAGTSLTVTVQDPVNPRAELMSVEFQLSGDEPVRAILDFPDQVVQSSMPLWLTFKADKPVTFTDGPTIDLYGGDAAASLAPALAYRTLLLKGQFQALSEPRPFGRMPATGELESWFASEGSYADALRELYGTLDYLHALAPQDPVVRSYYEWLYRKRLTGNDDTALAPLPLPANQAPEWANRARQTWLASRSLVQWWLENRSLPENGEFGGVIGDDSDLYGNFAPFPYFEDSGTTQLLLQRARSFFDLVQQETVKDGINRRTMDPLHAYEEGLNHIALLAQWNYGDPKYLEAAMASARAVAAQTVVTEKGHRHFRSQNVGLGNADGKKIDYDGGYSVMLWHPALEVLRYNRNPQALEWVRQWEESNLAHQRAGEWISAINVAAEAPLDKGNLIPGLPAKWLKVLTARSFGLQQSQPLWFLYEATGDKKYLDWLQKLWAKPGDYFGDGKTVDDYLPDIAYYGTTGQNSKILAARQPVLATSTWLTGNKKPVLDAMARNEAAIDRFHYIFTDAEMFTDRLFLHQIDEAAYLYLGGTSTRNKMFPSQALSYSGFGDNYAAWVLANQPDKLKVLLYNFDAQPLTGHLTIWRLQHGRYQVSTGTDTNNDDRADGKPTIQTLELGKGTRLPMTLEPRRVTVLEITQREVLDDLQNRADLALSPSEIKIENGVLSGEIHNLGSRPADADITLFNAQGKPVARQTLGPIEAPNDLLPRQKSFHFTGLPANTNGWKLVVDDAGKVAEIYEGNNTVLLETNGFHYAVSAFGE